jgi:uncharacterized protein (TIGR00255 family)
MINSMTGYGQAQGEFNGINYVIEIKTVNNRYFKTIIKLPELVAFVEEDIEKLLRSSLSRGTVNYVLRLKDVSSNSLFEINENALRTVVEKLNRAISSTGAKGTIDIGNLLVLPGIIQPAIPEDEAAEKIKEVVMNISRQAIENLKNMRATEGGFLEADMKNRCKIIEENLEQIGTRRVEVLNEYAKKLKARVENLLAHAELKLDEEILAREVAIYADRSDISEEIARLNSHLHQFAQSCQANDQAGRRMDFISQEMLREANTIASKSTDTEITRCVVEIKCQVDRIKEQVQNVE